MSWDLTLNQPDCKEPTENVKKWKPFKEKVGGKCFIAVGKVQNIFRHSEEFPLLHFSRCVTLLLDLSEALWHCLPNLRPFSTQECLWGRGEMQASRSSSHVSALPLLLRSLHQALPVGYTEFQFPVISVLYHSGYITTFSRSGTWGPQIEGLIIGRQGRIKFWAFYFLSLALFPSN